MMTRQQRLIARQPSASPQMYGEVISSLSNTHGIGTAPGSSGSAAGVVSSFDRIERDIFYKNLADFPVTLAIGISEQDLDDTLAGLRGKLGLLAAAFTAFSARICVLVLRILSQNRRLMTSDTLSQASLAELQRLSEHFQMVREHNGKRIAQDIDDDLGQNLLVLKMDVAALGKYIEETHPPLNQRAVLALSNINAAILSVKSIMNDLRPATLELGLFAAVEWQLERFSRASGIACKLLASEEAELGLDEAKTSAVFRLFQESLTNVARHAHATKVEVTLRRDAQGFSMRIKDNGKGLAPGDREKTHSFGLTGIKERTRALDAVLLIESSPGTGTVLPVFTEMQEKRANQRQMTHHAVSMFAPDASAV